MWQKVESDDDVLSGRSGSGREHRVVGPGSGGDGSQASFSSRHGHPHMHSYPPHPMYFTYPHPMTHSMFPSAGGGDARNRIGISSHPFFSHLPRLGYSPSHPHLQPPPIHHTDGGGGGPYPRLGRPWWTVPPFPPPSHLHHPHHSHPPPSDNVLDSNQDHSPLSSHSTTSVPESAVNTITSSVPRTSSRNAYSQQRLSILKKQQHQKEQASKTDKGQVSDVHIGSKNLSLQNNTAKPVSTDSSQRVKLILKTKETESTFQLNKEDKGTRGNEDVKLSSTMKLSQ